MQPQGGGLPEGGVLQQIEKDFGSFTNFREEFIRSAVQLLGSGWVWLVCKFPSHFL
jgi:Fe-Mn family superoxide dismutase